MVNWQESRIKLERRVRPADVFQSRDNPCGSVEESSSAHFFLKFALSLEAAWWDDTDFRKAVFLNCFVATQKWRPFSSNTAKVFQFSSSECHSRWEMWTAGKCRDAPTFARFSLQIDILDPLFMQPNLCSNLDMRRFCSWLKIMPLSWFALVRFLTMTTTPILVDIRSFYLQAKPAWVL